MPQTWTTAYLAALIDPGSTLPFLPQPRAFSGQTLRQAVRLCRGGTTVRLVLSNEFGHRPLLIDAITVRGASGTGRPAPLGGSRSWEVPPGQTATSDPITLPVAPGDELTIDCFVAATTEPAAVLPAAQRTTQIAPGDQLGRRRLTDADRSASLYWIARVLVDAPAAGPVVVALGDSITRGDGTSVDRDQRYPDHLQRRLLAAGMAGGVVLNAGLSGNRLLRALVGPAMTDRFPRDVLSVAEATHVVVMAGINDLGLPGVLGQRRPGAGELLDGLFGLARRAQRRGIQPILGTITPFAGSTYPALVAEGNEDLRQEVNHAVTAQRDWPVADFAAAVADPADPTRLAAAFDSGDGVHPGDAGARALADAVDIALFAAAPTVDPAGPGALRSVG
jgi:lysophospholipase L1-like esterase